MSLQKELIEAGWKQAGKNSWMRGSRVIFTKPGWRILGATIEYDHWTLQRMRGNSVDWFIDFPKQAGVQAMIVVVMQCEFGET